jgi:hypothetical protein
MTVDSVNYSLIPVTDAKQINLNKMFSDLNNIIKKLYLIFR